MRHHLPFVGGLSTLPLSRTDSIHGQDGGVGVCVRHCLECMCNAFAPCTRRQCVLEWRCGHLDKKPCLLCNRLGDQTPDDVASHNAANSTCFLLQCCHPSHTHHVQHLSWNFVSCQMLSNLAKEFLCLVLSSMGFTCSVVIPDGSPAAPRLAHFNDFENKLWSNVKTLSNRLNSSGTGSLGTRGRRRNWFNVS